MHVMNCVSLVNDKENGAISAEAGLMIGDTNEPDDQPPPPPPLPLPCFSIEAGLLPSSSGVPPPPPPPPPNLSRSSVSQLLNGHGHLSSKKKRIRSFFWKTIPEEQVRGKNNIWTISAKQNYQIDTKTIEEFFGQQEEPAPLESRSRSLRRSFKDSKQEINILDAKRSMNLGIFLKQFKKSLDSIIEDLHIGRDVYSSETLRELLKLLPEAEEEPLEQHSVPDEMEVKCFDTDGKILYLEKYWFPTKELTSAMKHYNGSVLGYLELKWLSIFEVKKLKDFSGDLSKLCQADSFMYMLIQVPNYSLRIEAMVLKKEFSPSCTSLQKNMTIIKMATKELMCCEELHAILHLVLQAGNIMNAGGCAGNAVGFKLSSLLKLADTKANKPGMNLLHFVALEAQKKDKVLLTFSEKLHHVHEAARISLENIETELHALSSKTKSLKDSIRRDTELFRQMEGFLQFAVKELKELDHWKRDLMKEAHALIDFLCEDKETMKLEECFQIFRDFCLRFNKAVKENKEREAQQLQQLQRLKELEDKRRSWVAADISAFGRSSSENDVGALTKRGLEEFLPFLQHRPQSPSYRNTSTRRSRHSLGVTAERELFTFLGTSKGEDPNRFNSLPCEHPCPTSPNVAWSENKDPVDVSFTHLHLDQGSRNKDHSYQFFPSQTQHVEDTAHDNLYSNQEASKNDKYRFSVPCVESSDAVPWDLSMEEHEHIPRLHKFDSHETNDVDDSSPIHFVAGMQGLDAQDGPLHSPGITGNPSDREKTHYKIEHSAKMMSYVNEALEPDNNSPISSDGSISGTKTQGPVFFESDFECSLTLDISEENSSKLGGNKIDNKSGANSPYDLQTGDNAIFSNDKSDCSNKPSFPKEKSVRSKDTLGPKRNSLKDKTSGTTKPSTASPNHPRPVRTLNSSENASMRKVVPISRSTKPASPSCPKKPEAKPVSRDMAVGETRLSRRNSVRGIVDAAPKPQYRQSISVEEPKFQHGTTNSSGGHFEKEQLQHKGSFKKPSCKPVRYVPKSKTDETKMCRSLNKSQGPVDANKSTSAIAPKAPAPVPSFARNTVASSSKCAKVDLPLPSRAPPLTRSLSQRLPRMKVTAASDDSNPKENNGSTLKRANSAKIIKRNMDNSDLLSVKAEPVPREQIIMEKSGSFKCKDGSQTTIGKLFNHF